MEDGPSKVNELEGMQSLGQSRFILCASVSPLHHLLLSLFCSLRYYHHSCYCHSSEGPKIDVSSEFKPLTLDGGSKITAKTALSSLHYSFYTDRFFKIIHAFSIALLYLDRSIVSHYLAIIMYSVQSESIKKRRKKR